MRINLALAALLAMNIVMGAARADQTQFISDETRGYLLQPARIIAQGIAGPKTITLDGRYVAWIVGDGSPADAVADAQKWLYRNGELPPPHYLFVVYDRLTHSTEDRGSLPKGCKALSVSQVGQHGSFLLAVGFQPADPKAPQKIAVLMSSAGEKKVSRNISSDAAEFMVEGDPETGYMVGSRGLGGGLSHVSVWNEEGGPVYQQDGKFTAGIAKGVLYLFGFGGQGTLSVNLATGRETAISRKAASNAMAVMEAEQAGKPTLVWSFAKGRLVGTDATRLSVHVENSKEEHQVATGVDDFQADIGDRFILYSDGEGLMIREITPLPAEIVPHLRWTRVHNRMAEDAGAVMRALMDYARDHKGFLPGADWKKVIADYMKDPRATDGFVLLIPGANINSSKVPSKVIMGVGQMPDGQFVGYLDGHAEWKKGA